MVKEEKNVVTGQILDACIEVQRNLGPGLLESTYEACLMKEFELMDSAELFKDIKFIISY